MAEEEASLQERMRRTTSKAFDTLDQTLRDRLRSEALDQLRIVDFTSYSLDGDDEVIFRRRSRSRLCRFGHCKDETEFSEDLPGPL